MSQEGPLALARGSTLPGAKVGRCLDVTINFCTESSSAVSCFLYNVYMCTRVCCVHECVVHSPLLPQQGQQAAKRPTQLNSSNYTVCRSSISSIALPSIERYHIQWYLSSTGVPVRICCFFEGVGSQWPQVRGRLVRFFLGNDANLSVLRHVRHLGRDSGGRFSTSPGIVGFRRCVLPTPLLCSLCFVVVGHLWWRARSPMITGMPESLSLL